MESEVMHLTQREGIEPFTVFLLVLLFGGMGLLGGQWIEHATNPRGPIVVKVELPIALMAEDNRDRSTSFSAMVDQGENR